MIALIALAAMHSSADMVCSEAVVAPGHPFWAEIRVKLDAGWHTYWLYPGDSGIPPRVEWNLPAGWKAGPLRFPLPERFKAAGLVNFGYEMEGVFLTKITPGPSTAKKGTVSIAAKLNCLVCQEACVAEEHSLRVPISIGAKPELGKDGAEISAALARVPPQAPMGLYTARREGAKIELTGPAPQGASFIPADASIDLSAPQESAVAGKLSLTLSSFAPAKVSRLRGLIIAPKGQSLRGGAAAYWIDISVENKL